MLSRDGGLPRAPDDWCRPSGPRAALGAVAGAAQRPKDSVLVLSIRDAGRYRRRLLGRRDTQKGDAYDRRDHNLAVVSGGENAANQGTNRPILRPANVKE